MSFTGKTDSLRIKNEENKKLIVRAIPEIIIMYLNHNTPVHSTYIPPKVSTMETNGSIISTLINFLLIDVNDNNRPNSKNIIDIDNI